MYVHNRKTKSKEKEAKN